MEILDVSALERLAKWQIYSEFDDPCRLHADRQRTDTHQKRARRGYPGLCLALRQVVFPSLPQPAQQSASGNLSASASRRAARSADISLGTVGDPAAIKRRGERFLNWNATMVWARDQLRRRPMPKPNFRFTHYDLNEQRAGTIIEVTLNAVANVRLMTAPNYQRFTEVLDFKYVGGVARKSPIRLSIPESGHWHLVVDMEGHHGLAESAVKLIASAGQMRAS